MTFTQFSSAVADIAPHLPQSLLQYAFRVAETADNGERDNILQILREEAAGFEADKKHFEEFQQDALTVLQELESTHKQHTAKHADASNAKAVAHLEHQLSS